MPLFKHTIPGFIWIKAVHGFLSILLIIPCVRANNLSSTDPNILS
uniref:Uncharacterized protein n=1 Tax=Anguilla anguilla TaxID=7936 RepID=A0A0E9PUS1_ANGAN